jgi:predicted aminopeptidase
LKDDYQDLKRKWGGYAGYDRWFAEPLSNAHLAAVATYHDFVPGFRALLRQQGSLPAFYAAVKHMAAEDKTARDQQLALLGEPARLAQDGAARQNP